MPEDDFFAPRQGGYRGSRAPGFSSGPMSQSTGTLLTTIGTDTQADQNAVSQLYDTSKAQTVQQPDYIGELGKGAAVMGAEYAGNQIGSVAGANIIDGGKSIGEGLSQGVSSFGDKVGGWFGASPSVNEAAIPPTSFGEGMNGFAPGVGEGIGEGASSGVGEMAGSAGGEAAGGIGEASFGESLGSEFGAGSNIGAGVGSGIARSVIGLAMGESPAQALKAGAIAGVGTYVGTAIGSAIAGPVGGFVGGFLGSTIGGMIGGRVICTELRAQARITVTLLSADLEFSRANISPITLRGYHVWAVPFVRLMRRSKLATNIAAPFAIWRAEELAYQMGLRKKPNWKGKMVRWIGEPLCFCIGLFVKQTDWHTLYNNQTAPAAN